MDEDATNNLGGIVGHNRVVWRADRLIRFLQQTQRTFARGHHQNDWAFIRLRGPTR